MSEALQGNLEQLSLPEILKLLIQGKKTGRLSLTNDLDSGDIFMFEGHIVHIAAGIEYDETALFELISWPKGRFLFEPGVQSPDNTVTTETEILLRETEKRAQEMQEIRRVIPNENAVFRLSPSGSSDAVSLQPQEWQVLAHINGARDASEIAELLELEKLEVLKVLARLDAGGLLAVTERSENVVEPLIGSAFFERLSNEFTDLIGPMGPVIIDEVVDTMGKTRESFPRSQVADLIERISGDIEDEEKRLHFQQIMIDLLREF